MWSCVGANIPKKVIPGIVIFISFTYMYMKAKWQTQSMANRTKSRSSTSTREIESSPRIMELYSLKVTPQQHLKRYSLFMPHNTTNLSLIFCDLQLPIKPLPICLRGFMRHFSGRKEVFLGMQSFYVWVTWDFLTNKTSKVKKETLLGPVFPGFLIIVFATAAC